ncbi:hypothetical protein EV144_105286 [Flavobacterium sp. 270]|nr:hypothetical protein EV144_105286 [Flavobacterium sp. 270]
MSFRLKGEIAHGILQRKVSIFVVKRAISPFSRNDKTIRKNFATLRLCEIKTKSPVQTNGTFCLYKLQINLKQEKPETKIYSLEAKYLSASKAAIHPVPAAVIA